MTWVKIDDAFAEHEKVIRASPHAITLHIRAICWSSRRLTDGFISTAAVDLLGSNLVDWPVHGFPAKPEQIAEQLEHIGMWDKCDEGWKIHNYLKYNPSRKQVLSERKRKAKNVKDHRERNRDSNRHSNHGVARKFQGSFSGPVPDPLPLPQDQKQDQNQPPPTPPDEQGGSEVQLAGLQDPQGLERLRGYGQSKADEPRGLRTKRKPRAEERKAAAEERSAELRAGSQYPPLGWMDTAKAGIKGFPPAQTQPAGLTPDNRTRLRTRLAELVKLAWPSETPKKLTRMVKAVQDHELLTTVSTLEAKVGKPEPSEVPG